MLSVFNKLLSSILINQNKSESKSTGVSDEQITKASWGLAFTTVVLNECLSTFYAHLT